MKKLIVIILIIAAFSMFGCQRINAYQKSIYDDDTKISNNADSYFFKNSIGNHTNQKQNLIIRVLQVNTLYTISM